MSREKDPYVYEVRELHFYQDIAIVSPLTKSPEMPSRAIYLRNLLTFTGNFDKKWKLQLMCLLLIWKSVFRAQGIDELFRPM